MKLNSCKKIYCLEDFEATISKLSDFLFKVLEKKGFLFLGFRYYQISIDDLDNIVDKNIRETSKKLAQMGKFVEDLSQEENLRFVKENATFENDYWYTGYERRLYKEPKTYWIKVCDRKMIEVALEINLHFVCVISELEDEFKPELLVRCTETIDEEGVDKDMMIFEEIREGAFFNTIIPIFEIQW